MINICILLYSKNFTRPENIIIDFQTQITKKGYHINNPSTYSGSKTIKKVYNDKHMYTFQ
jgi:Fe-S cluster assembly iron-binding protein IscA